MCVIYSWWNQWHPTLISTLITWHIHLPPRDSVRNPHWLKTNMCWLECTLQEKSHLILVTVLWDKYNRYPYFTDEKTRSPHQKFSEMHHLPLCKDETLYPDIQSLPHTAAVLYNIPLGPIPASRSLTCLKSCHCLHSRLVSPVRLWTLRVRIATIFLILHKVYPAECLARGRHSANTRRAAGKKTTWWNAYLRHCSVETSTDISVTVFTSKVSVFVNSTGRQEWIKETTPRSSVHGAQCWARRPGSPISPPRPPRTPRESNWTPSAFSPLICKIRQLSLQNWSQFKCYPWVHKALAWLMKTALEIHWEFLPLGQNVKKGSSEVNFSDPLKVERHLEGYHMHNKLRLLLHEG